MSKLKEFMDIDDLSSADIVDFLFGSLKLLEKDPSIISKIIDDSKDGKICMYIISNIEVQRWEQVVSKNDRALCIKSLRYLYSKLPNEQKKYYKIEFFDKHPEIFEGQNI